MAIIACPYCGKRISDRMEKCPHCSATLIKLKSQETVVAEYTGNFIAKSVLNIVSAIIFVFFAFFAWKYVATIYSGRFIGINSLLAISYADTNFSQNALLLFPISAALFLGISVLLKQKLNFQFIVSIIVTIILSLIGFKLQENSVLSGTIPAELLTYTESLSLAFGFTFPMLLGSLYLLCHKRSLQKSLIMQLIGVAIFFFASSLLDIYLVAVLGMGTQGFSKGNLISAIIVLVFAILTSKEFQKLLTGRINLK